MDIAHLTDDELKTELCGWAARVAAGEARLLLLIGELDAREVWAEHGVLSCAHWVAWRLGVSRTTARERVRVARALRELPLLAAALGRGRVSYAQARAITRVATVADEQRWVELARHVSAAQLEQTARGAARARAQVSEQERVRPASGVRWEDDGTATLSFNLPAHLATAVLAALEQAQAAEQDTREQRRRELAERLAAEAAGASAEAPAPYVYVEPRYPEVVSPLFATPEQEAANKVALQAYWEEVHRRRALRDAWREHERTLEQVAVAEHIPTGRASLADGLVHALLGPADARKVVVKLLHDPLSGWARTSRDELLPPAILTRLERDLPVQRSRAGAAAAQDLTRYDQGRSSRLVSPALRALLGALDGERCRFPGCRHTRFLHAHHLKFWRDGGRTDLQNLVLLCSHHHQLLHEHGYQLVLGPDRRLEVTTPDGTRLLHQQQLPPASAEALPDVPPLQAPTGGHFDLGYVTTVMLAHAA